MEVAQLRQLAGQSVDRDMTKATLSKIFEVLEQRGLSLAGTTISFGDWFAGGSFLGSAVWELADTRGLGFSYTFAIEGLRLASSSVERASVRVVRDASRGLHGSLRCHSGAAAEPVPAGCHHWRGWALRPILRGVCYASTGDGEEGWGERRGDHGVYHCYKC